MLRRWPCVALVVDQVAARPSRVRLRYANIDYHRGGTMKNAYVPLAWFVILGSMLAAASGVSLVLV